MNWMSKLLRKPAAKPMTRSSPRREVKPPVDDTGRLRGALVAAVDDEERSRTAAELGRALAGRQQSPQSDDLPDVWVAAVCHVADKALALAWMAGLKGAAALGEVANHGRIAEVRLAAAMRVEDPVVLERIALASRDKDKRVYRHCSDLLEQRRQAAKDARRAEELAAALRELLDIVPLHLSRLLDLEKEVRALGAGDQAVAECNALLDQAHARLQQESTAQRDLQTRKAAAQQMLEECAHREWAEPAQVHAWRVRLETLAKAQRGLPPWLSGQASARKLDELLHDLECRMNILGAEGERILACEQFMAAHTAGRPTDQESSALTAAAWAALAKPENPAIRKSLELRWQELQPQPIVVPAPPRTPPSPAPAKIDRDAVRRLLEDLERAVEQGLFADAEAAAKALDVALGGTSLHGDLESRLQRAKAQLGKLRGWARWGTEQARENLIAAAEQLLAGAAADVDDLAKGVHGLREKWKELNAFGPAAKERWERFDAVLEKAYQPVAAHHAEEAARHAAVRDVKLAWCAEWESFLSNVAWEHADYKLIEVQRQEMLQRWRGAEHAGFRDERMLRKRFDTLLKSIDQRLNAMRANELARREQLIAEAEALRDVPDIGRAITEAKALQERWTGEAVSLRLNRRDEQALWQRFRAACAGVFARRDAQRAQQVTQREERTQAIRGLLDAFAASLAESDANATKRALGRFRVDWEAAKANSRDLADGLQARARDLQQQAQQRIDMLLDAKHNAHFELLAQKAALADGIEAAAAAQVPADAIIAAARQAWDALPRLPGKTESLLAERFAGAAGATATALAAGRDSREAMLLDLEIALGLPSPAAYAEARRRRQLERLQNRFGAGSPQSPETETLLVRWYATAATPDAALDQRMAAVKRKLLEQAKDSR